MKTKTHIIQVNEREKEFVCGHTGGEILLKEGQNIPYCQQCHKEMSLFFQLVTSAEFNVPFKSGSRLSVFSCLKQGEIPMEQYSNLDTKVQDTYNTMVHEHYSLIFNLPEGNDVLAGIEPVIQNKTLSAHMAEEAVIENKYLGLTSQDERFKIGGVPAWINYSVNLKCLCGGKLVFLCQLPLDFEFYGNKTEADKTSTLRLNLFNGNQLYILACEKQCSPCALIPVCDN